MNSGLTKAQFEAKLKELLEDSAYSYPDTVSFEEVDAGYDVYVANMYSFVDLSFAQLLELSKFFGTVNLHVGDKDSTSGCETCDYGSCYSYTLRVRA